MANTKITSNVISDDIALGGNPTTTTQSAGNDTTRIATTAFVKAAIDATINSAPGALDTLNELAAAIGDDANFSTTITNSIATKLPLAGGTMTGDLTLSSGTSNKPKLTITNTNADSTPPYLILKKDSASPADNDEVGRIYMYGDDDAGNATEAFLAIGKMTDVSNGSEDSSLDMYTYAAGSQKSTLTLKGGQVGIGSIDPDSALHVQSGSAGSVTAYANTTFTTEASSTNQFWSILGPANQNQGLLFGDADSNWRGQIRYNHDGDYMQLYAGQQDSPPAVTISSGYEGRSLGVKNSSPRAHLHVGGHGVTTNTTLDVSRTAIFRTEGTGNYSSSGNKSAAHAASFMRSSDAATGDQVGHSYVFDNGNWSATAEIMAEVENDANAYSRLNFKTWNGSMLTRQVITSDGQVIKPYQSGFYAVKSSAQTISVNQAVIFNTATENVGADYNTSNGIYTAPYSGFYLFSYTILLGPNLTNDIDVDHYLKTSNRSYIGGHPGRTRYLTTGTSGWGDGYMGFGHTQIAYMDANDTAYVDFSQLYYNNSNGTAPVYANTGNNWTKFSGYFLG